MSESTKKQSAPAKETPPGAKQESRSVKCEVITFAFKYRGAVYVPNEGKPAITMMTPGDAREYEKSGDVKIVN